MGVMGKELADSLREFADCEHNSWTCNNCKCSTALSTLTMNERILRSAMDTKKTAATSPDEAIVTCVVGTWSIVIKSSGDTEIFDGGGRQVHHSDSHQSTATHFAVLLQQRRELRAELESKITLHDAAASPWIKGTSAQRRWMEQENSPAYTAWKIAKDLRKLLSFS